MTDATGSSSASAPGSHASESGARAAIASPYLEVSAEAIARILVVSSPHLERPSQVVGVVDANAAPGDDAAALLELRRRAAFMHADAVIGIESHPEPGGPVHLSGLAVRFADGSPRN